MSGENKQNLNGPSATHSDEIFFIPPSDIEDEEGDFSFHGPCETNSGIRITAAQRNEDCDYKGASIGDDLSLNISETLSSSPYYSPTVHNVLFWDPYPRGAGQALKAGNTSRANLLAEGEKGSGQLPLGLEESAYPHPEDSRWYAGGSPVAMPRPQTVLSPLPLRELLDMTCVMVRNRLENFFIRKESNFRAFQDIEKSAGLQSGDDDAKTMPRDPNETMETMWLRRRCRDRRARLVNISNWRDGVESVDDILLPSALVPQSSYYHYYPVLPQRDQGSLISQGEASSCQAREQRLSREGAKPVGQSPPRTLREHQIEGIRFMWSILVEGPVGQVPAVGCILAHTMGLGKTAQVVIFTHLFSAFFSRSCETSDEEGFYGARSPTSEMRSYALGFRGIAPKRAREGEPVDYARSTTPSKLRILVVAPKSTLPGWLKEFTSWSAYFPSAQRLSPMLIDSSGSRLTERLQAFLRWRREGGVLLIGYETLSRLTEVVKERRLLSEADAYTELMVCDEAHRLKSAHLKVVSALSSLHPLRRLLLTGTPLQNHLDEYWAMVNFAMHRYFDRQHFNSYFINPIESSVNHTASKRAVDLARKAVFTLANETKPFVQRVDCTPLKEELPPLHEYVVVVPMTELQRNLYQRFLQVVLEDKGSDFRFLPAVSLSGKIAAHPQLAFDQFMREEQLRIRRVGKPLEMEEEVNGAAHQGFSKQGKQTHTRAGEQLASSDERSDDDDDLLDGGGAVDRLCVTSSSFYQSLSYSRLCNPPPDYVLRLEDGRKMHVSLCIILEAMRLGEKCVLFSLSTRLLDLFEVFIGQVNAGVDVLPPRRGEAEAKGPKPAPPSQQIRYCRLDGTHSTAQRDAMITGFQTDDGPTLFLMSMRAGGVGVTLPAATRVILLDTSFNPSDDRQAIGRAYRYGQTRPVWVYRLLCEPALEHGVFRQKLAKEWLFRTVVEEAAVRRDGLVGMRMREVLAGLRRTARVLRRPPPRPTPSQADLTRRMAEEDAVLAAIRPLVLYIQHYEMFLTQDTPLKYGEAEAHFYLKYREDRSFERTGEATQGVGAEAKVSHLKAQSEAQPQSLEPPTPSFISLVDDIIRSRAGTDTHLRNLLHAMGLKVDSITGTVQKIHPENERILPVEGDPLEGSTQAQERNISPDGEFEVNKSQAVNSVGLTFDGDCSPAGAAPPLSHSQHLEGQYTHQKVLLLDLTSEEDEGADAQTSGNCEAEDPQTQEENMTDSTHHEQQQSPVGSKKLTVIDPGIYAAFRPGSSPQEAIDIDEY